MPEPRSVAARVACWALMLARVGLVVAATAHVWLYDEMTNTLMVGLLIAAWLPFDYGSHLAVFRFPYSWFGPFRGRMPPWEEPVVIVPASHLRVESLAYFWLAVRYSIFKSGIAVKVFSVGEFFITFDEIVQIEPEFGPWAPRLIDEDLKYVIHHSNAAVRSPIVIPWDVYRDLVAATPLLANKADGKSASNDGKWVACGE